MNAPSSDRMPGKLMLSPVDRTGPNTIALSDPIADTPMVLTLDQLDTYDHDPRLTRNPRFDEIKSSIFQRNLDAPPPVTRRPGADRYIIRNGGNTRLQILRELWSETKDKRFYEIKCLFRPWVPRGEIVLLTGHLAENELRGNLTFIERALGVAKASEMYESEVGADSSLSQSELARRLTADGYPISQSQISRMQDTVRYLLPAIPKILYAGLGRPQIERLAVLRKQAARVWERRYPASKTDVDFAALFQEVLASFDGNPDTFTVQRAQDELLGQMADLLAIDYDTLALEVAEPDARRVVMEPDSVRTTTEPAPPEPSGGKPIAAAPNPSTPSSPRPPDSRSHDRPPPLESRSSNSPNSKAPIRGSLEAPKAETLKKEPAQSYRDDQRIAQNVVSPVQTTDRLREIQQSIAAATGDTVPDFRANVLKAVPVQAGGLHPISDIWYIESGLDSTDHLRLHIAQLAHEIAAESNAADTIDVTPQGLGYSVREPSNQREQPHFLARATSTLLSAIATPYLTRNGRRASVGPIRLAEDLARLLVGQLPPVGSPLPDRLNDVSIVKLFRLIRLSRRIVELESAGLDSAK